MLFDHYKHHPKDEVNYHNNQKYKHYFLQKGLKEGKHNQKINLF